MARTAVRLAAIDIGTNSMRLLIAEVEDGNVRWLDRRTTVTGLGAGVDRTGNLDPEAVDRTIRVLAQYGGVLGDMGVAGARAIATSATRDAANRDEFLDRAEVALGIRPDVISGAEEAGLAFTGATQGVGAAPPHVVVDIGGGSTEFVFGEDAPSYRLSLDIGSVRLTDRILIDRPAAPDQLARAQDFTADILEGVTLPARPKRIIGVAGTFTSLSAISQDLPAYDPGRVHHSILSLNRIAELVLYLAGLSLPETAAIPSLDPARAPVILAGAVVAEEALRRCQARDVLVSEHDSLDGIVLGLAGCRVCGD